MGKNKKNNKIKKKGNMFPSNKTISGFNPSSSITYLVSAMIGLIVFVVAPYVINKFNNNLLGVLMTICPSGMIMALFINESQFGPLVKNLLIMPIFFFMVNLLIYIFYFYFNWSAISCILFITTLWFLTCVVIFFVN
jgi:hypothetical protein